MVTFRKEFSDKGWFYSDSNFSQLIIKSLKVMKKEVFQREIHGSGVLNTRPRLWSPTAETLTGMVPDRLRKMDWHLDQAGGTTA